MCVQSRPVYTFALTMSLARFIHKRQERIPELSCPAFIPVAVSGILSWKAVPTNLPLPSYPPANLRVTDPPRRLVAEEKPGEGLLRLVPLALPFSA